MDGRTDLAVMCPASQSSSLPREGRAEGCPPRGGCVLPTSASGLAWSSALEPGRGSDLQHRPQDACSSQGAGGPPGAPRAGRRQVPGMEGQGTALLQPHTPGGPGGQAFPMELTAPTATPCSFGIRCQSLRPTGKTNYLPGENVLPVSWTIAFNICLFQK